MSNAAKALKKAAESTPPPTKSHNGVRAETKKDQFKKKSPIVEKKNVRSDTPTVVVNVNTGGAPTSASRLIEIAQKTMKEEVRPTTPPSGPANVPTTAPWEMPGREPLVRRESPLLVKTEPARERVYKQMTPPSEPSPDNVYVQPIPRLAHTQPYRGKKEESSDGWKSQEKEPSHQLSMGGFRFKPLR